MDARAEVLDDRLGLRNGFSVWARHYCNHLPARVVHLRQLMLCAVVSIGSKFTSFRCFAISA